MTELSDLHKIIASLNQECLELLEENKRLRGVDKQPKGDNTRLKESTVEIDK